MDTPPPLPWLLLASRCRPRVGWLTRYCATRAEGRALAGWLRSLGWTVGVIRSRGSSRSPR